MFALHEGVNIASCRHLFSKSPQRFLDPLHVCASQRFKTAHRILLSRRRLSLPCGLLRERLHLFHQATNRSSWTTARFASALTWELRSATQSMDPSETSGPLHERSGHDGTVTLLASGCSAVEAQPAQGSCSSSCRCCQRTCCSRLAPMSTFVDKKQCSGTMIV